MARATPRPTQPPPPPPPTIAIYQHAEHVNGILQQLFEAGILTSQDIKQNRSDTEATDLDTRGGVTTEGKVGLPSTLGISVKVEAGAGGKRREDIVNATESTSTYVFSQAYFLHVIRKALQGRGLLRRIADSKQAEEVAIWDFVEFSAAFRPNPVNAMLDIFTPDLIETITLVWRLQSASKNFPTSGMDGDQARAYLERKELLAQRSATLARAVAKSVSVDFRNDATLEFYGNLGSGDDAVTAVTICDKNRFLVDDADRILDGNYTVLGKVTSLPEVDVPLLARNKLLSRFNPEAVDQAVKSLDEQFKKSFSGTKTAKSLPGQLLDVALPSRIDGLSFRVIPIAIYA